MEFQPYLGTGASETLYSYIGGDIYYWKIYGNGGNDYIEGGGYADTLYGGDGSDTIYGWNEWDTIFGDMGDDRLYGESGEDSLFGNDGDDILDGGADRDYMVGGVGDDEYYVTQSNETLIEGVGAGQDRVYAYVNYTLPANFERLYLMGSATSGNGNSANNLLVGSGPNNGNTLNGYGGNDTIIGNGGNDTLIGDSGNDNLNGSTGRDTLTGGSGADRFSYDAVDRSPANSGRDIIMDFTSGTDKVDLSFIDANLSVSGSQAFQTSQITYSLTTGIATIDILGSSQDMQIEFYGIPFIDWPDIIL